MKTTMQKLVELAEAYVEFGKKVDMRFNYHTGLRDQYKKDSDFPEIKGDSKIRVYFGDEHGTWEVQFGKTIITGYSGNVTHPYYHAENLGLLKDLEDAQVFYKYHLLPNIDKFRQKYSGMSEELRLEKIERLKRELEQLEKK